MVVVRRGLNIAKTHPIKAHPTGIMLPYHLLHLPLHLRCPP
jgi:hypothetical protein